MTWAAGAGRGQRGGSRRGAGLAGGPIVARPRKANSYHHHLQLTREVTTVGYHPIAKVQPMAQRAFSAKNQQRNNRKERQNENEITLLARALSNHGQNP